MAADDLVVDSVTESSGVEPGGTIGRGEGPERAAPIPRCGLCRLRYVASLWSLRTVDDLEFDLLAFFEGPESGALNRGEVHEHVVSTFALNETVPLSVVEPLDLADNTHTTCLPCENRGAMRRIAPRRQFRGLDEVQKKDRNVRSRVRRRPAQRQPATLVG